MSSQYSDLLRYGDLDVPYTTAQIEKMFEDWGRASGWHKCSESSLSDREDVKQYARIGLLVGLKTFDPSVKDKHGKPVTLKGWCILCMRSRVNLYHKRPDLWRKDDTFVGNSGLYDLLQSTFYADTDGLYNVLVGLVHKDLRKTSPIAATIFSLRIHLGMEPKTMASVLGIHVKKVKKIMEGFRPKILYYSRRLAPSL